MHGKIISKANDFGFIHCAKGVPHYFSRSMLTADCSFDALEIGMSVTFEPVAGPKGMRAKAVCPREVLFGWTTGPFILWRDSELPIHVDGQQPSAVGERGAATYAEFGLPFVGDSNKVLDELVTRVKATGVNGIDRLKLERREHIEDGVTFKWQAWTGRMVFYHYAVEVDSIEQAAQLVDEHNARFESVYPTILKLQADLIAEENAFQVNMPCIIGDTFIALRQGEALHSGKKELCYVMLQSGWSRESSAGKKDLLTAAQAAGANCVTELQRLEHTRSSGNYYYTMYSWSGRAGVWGSHKLVEDAEQAKRINTKTKTHCDEVQANLLELQASLDHQRKSGLTDFIKRWLAIIAIIVVLCVVFA